MITNDLPNLNYYYENLRYINKEELRKYLLFPSSNQYGVTTREGALCARVSYNTICDHSSATIRK